MFAVAIDGPAGAGKSSLAKAAAQELGFVYVDTGGPVPHRGPVPAGAGRGPGGPPGGRGRPAPHPGGAGAQPRGPENVPVRQGGHRPHPHAGGVHGGVEVSAIPAVRAFLLELQRDLARKNNVLMDGRDIGTVVLPNAQLKIFLTASAEERAGRRVAQLEESGHPADYDSILRDIQQRDYQDSHRETAPLKPAEDSVLLDTTGEDFSQSLGRLVSLVRERL